MALFSLLLAISTPVSSLASGELWEPRTTLGSQRLVCFSTPCGALTRANGGRARQVLPHYYGRSRWPRPSPAVNPLSMSFGGGATERYSWDETGKELNVQARMPAWAKGKSVMLDMTKNHIRLALKEEEDKPIMEGDFRGVISLDGSYWTMESLDDGGKMIYLTLEKAPQLAGMGPWMGVVVGEKQVDSNYPEEKKAAGLAALSQDKAEDAEGDDISVQGPSGLVDKDGFCKDLLAVQAMSGAMIARQVPVNGNALFSAVAASQEYISTGVHTDVNSAKIEADAKELRQRTIDYLADAYKGDKQLGLQGESMGARQFIAAQARANSMADGDEYLMAMRDDTMWGGGGEVVGLTHVLKRPIHVYELHSTGRRFGLRFVGAFGTPMYNEEKAIHLLTAYEKFPELDPGTQTNQGNHFLALYPYQDVPDKNKVKL